MRALSLCWQTIRTRGNGKIINLQLISMCTSIGDRERDNGQSRGTRKNTLDYNGIRHTLDSPAHRMRPKTTSAHSTMKTRRISADNEKRFKTNSLRLCSLFMRPNQQLIGSLAFGIKMQSKQNFFYPPILVRLQLNILPLWHFVCELKNKNSAPK